MVVFDSPQRARARNRRLVLDVVHSRRGVTRAQLGAIIKLSKTSIKEICDDLIAEGLLEEYQSEPSKRQQGRPALSLRISTTHGCVLGIDVGADKVSARTATLDGDVLAAKEVRTRREKPDKDYLLGLVREAVTSVRQSGPEDSSEFHTIVVSTPGVVDPRTQVVSLAPQILDWDGTDLRAAFAECLDVEPERVFVERQTDLSVLAEAVAGAAEGIGTVLYVQLGIGIGGGIIANGSPVTGAVGAAGELGYLPLSFGDDPPAGSGIGAWEWAAGGRAWARHGRAAATEPGGSRLRELAGGNPDEVDAEVVFRGIREGDQASLAVFRCMTHRIAAGIAAAVCVINPECVLIAGGLSKGGEMLLDALRDELDQLVPIMPDVRLAAFGGDGGVTGALYKATERAFDALNPMP
ncbi:ROK family protein [Mycolicibacterium fluoranthenivorans]|jgi:glucokinase|uniref:ROK family protein n=1 Tax=Mycolicibacterium fluoranthenivorans TaxID=258505 RepID=A0A7G8PDW5_9MYCO|nr:ROK family transcriptional regulator [Mycolicibacterium fluoranthenivorans]QNJ92531.1 ROK family protein [Mycolicibacterium fluoranthenivorans]